MFRLSIPPIVNFVANGAMEIYHEGHEGHEDHEEML